MTFVNKIKNYLVALSLRSKILLTGIVIIAIATGTAYSRIQGNSTENGTASTPPTQVQAKTIAQLSGNSDSALHLTGTLRNKREEDLRFEVPGQVKHVYKKVGSWVRSGTLIAEVENAAQRAGLTQALGALQSAKAQANSAKAQLTKAQNGATPEDIGIIESQVASTQTTLDNSYESARNALQNAYTGTVSATAFGSDTMMLNPTSAYPTLSFQTTENSAKIQATNSRTALNRTITRHSTANAYSLQDSEILLEIKKIKTELGTLRAFMSTLLTALNGAITTSIMPSSTITTYTASITSARAQVLGNISALTSAEAGINSATAALHTTKENQNKIVTPLRREDLATAKANLQAANSTVTTALGGYQAALANLEKTRLRAHISGRLASLSIRTGDFISTQNVGRILGTGGSEVVFFIPTDDSTRVSTGMRIDIFGSGVQGTIKTLSTNVSELTQQLEVRADLDSNLKVTNGSTVDIAIINSKDNATEVETMLIPISAIKFDTTGSFVLVIESVDDSTKLKAFPVEISSIVNDTVEITGDAINPETLIATDARGLSDAQLVVVVSE